MENWFQISVKNKKYVHLFINTLIFEWKSRIFEYEL